MSDSDSDSDPFMTLNERLFGTDNSTNQQPSILDQQKKEFNHEKILIDNQTYAKLRKYQAIDYNVHKHVFNRTYLYYIFVLLSIIFVFLSLEMLEFISFYTCIGFIGSMALVFIVICYLDLRINAYRRGHDWNKFYFNAIVRNKNDPYQNACTMF